ncbi:MULTISPECIES: exostosin domain-containing protein [unclassified Coleofasciculus]|uniref:exostosin domain-containing protein n=1 Tax=unclassified Coleofasciculus TaxID=2692782 RepID=UPI00187EF9E6|nr:MULTISPECIES: exostosin family protein [unclassified Coleofasciculus]MBE9126899.1 exostosin family protein [Coleofasciculus sp. LEGE 07081]MBE9150205.1 exostosin family protein [Coleofasciculus sp. LEGE 07092]
MWSVQNPLEIWVKEDFILPEFRPVPLLMHTTSPDTNPELEFWNLLREKLQGVVQVHWFKDLKDAGSIVVTPNHAKEYIRHTNKWASVCKLNQKVVASGRTPIIFVGGLEYKPKPGEIVFAGSTYRCKLEKSIVIPSWLYDIRRKIPLIQKPSIPTVGFVGNTQYPSRINSILRYFSISDSIVFWIAGSLLINRNLNLRMRLPIASRVRQKVITELKKAQNLKISVIERSAHHFVLPEDVKKRHRDEYIQNIQNNAYILVMRGDSNSGFQLWEVMSAGRIPIIIDTNQQFPNLGDLKWEDFSVIVPYSDLHRLGEIVQKFHDSLSDEKFRQACQKSRAAFEYLLPHNFILDALRDNLLSVYIK